MASDERNALAELADVLAWFVDESQDSDSVPTMQLPDAISKAHRIIAELAKVEYYECIDGMIRADEDEINSAFRKCRTIAEGMNFVLTTKQRRNKKMNKITPDTINVNGEEYVKMSSIPAAQPQAVSTDGLKFVICRGYYCGVHAGFLKHHDGNHCVLVNSRRLWSWRAKEGISLSAVAKYGVDASCTFPNSIDTIWLGDVYEVIPCTESAMKTIVEAGVCEQK